LIASTARRSLIGGANDGGAGRSEALPTARLRGTMVSVDGDEKILKIRMPESDSALGWGVSQCCTRRVRVSGPSTPRMECNTAKSVEPAQQPCRLMPELKPRA